ncbi:GxGYxYP domain-containing protein [Ktedonospora formicarum]|uniref:GxGYxYP putative glycoside hydrolase N-terminal domain-containing protein n=1 Tax=Ktedonospora formicarum TaxID=2778364 RepID=A0A8J3I0K2_9CHLR|nr:GxGYxYP domain-containing protein [Ktedonospora formicarum]GHO45391.1 hypothetical protein KSX_35540 [Ktedonospora formicarum]
MSTQPVSVRARLLQLRALFQPPRHLFIADITSASRDFQLAISTLAGLINRQRPELYLIYNDDARFWLQHVPDSIERQPLAAQGNDVLDALIQIYRERLKGLVVFDPTRPDTINLATTLSGLRDGIVVSPELTRKFQDRYQLPILEDLRAYGWSTRLQMYQWAAKQMLKDSSRLLLAGVSPEGFAPLRSLLVATRSFVYWLDARRYLPEPQAHWQSERCLMKDILASYPPGVLHMGWFISEGSGVQLTSRQAQLVYASDYSQNLEVWLSLPLEAIPESLPTAPAEEDVVQPAEKKVYLSFTISDGDNLQYCQHRMLHLWQDEARGSLPLGWTLSPALPYFAPPLAAYYHQSRSINDELIAAPSGAGYMFPSRWPTTHLDTFLRDTRAMMDGLDMTTLEVLDTDLLQGLGIVPFSLTGMGFTRRRLQQIFARSLYAERSGGILSGSGALWANWHLIGTHPWYQNVGLVMNGEQALRLITTTARIRCQRPLYLNLYVLAWQVSPSMLKEVVSRLGGEYEVVLPRDLLAMLAREKMRSL